MQEVNAGTVSCEFGSLTSHLAYSILSDPEKRRLFDQYGEEGLKDGGRGGGGGWGDMFDFFGGGRRNGQGRNGKRLVNIKLIGSRDEKGPTYLYRTSSNFGGFI